MKKLKIYSITLFLILFASTNIFAQSGEFITVWKTDNPSSRTGNTNTTIAFHGIGEDYTIEWEEVDNEINNHDIVLHITSIKGTPYILTLPVAGTYRLKVSPGSGTFNGLCMYESSTHFYDPNKLLKVENWGAIAWTSLDDAFYKAINMDITATDAPDLSGVTSLHRIFYNCSSLVYNESIDNWNTTNIENMSRVFVGAKLFNQPIGSWNTANVSDMSYLFYKAYSFDQSLETWDVSNVTNMHGMFYSAKLFNQPLDNWNVENVTDMENMFRSAKEFDQPLDNWNVSNVTEMDNMLSYSGMSITSYDATLIGWGMQNVQEGVNLGVTNIQYCAGQSARDNILMGDKGWSISGDVLSCSILWIGSSDTDWQNTANWKDGLLPPAGNDIIFATEDNNEGVAAQNPLYVTCTEADPMIIGNLINESDKSLIVPVGKAITVSGYIVGSSTMEDANKIQIKASAGQINGSFYAPFMKNRPIYGTVEFYAKGKKGTQTTWEDNIVGSPTYGNEFTASYGWQYFGIPVESLVASPTFNGSYIRKYDETTNGSQFYQKWTPLSETSILKAFKGYEITQVNPALYTIAGKLQTSDKTLTLTRRATYVAPDGDEPVGENGNHYGLGQNIFGNSYTTSLDISQLEFPSEIEPTVYLYNTGSFTDWGNTTGTQTNDGTQQTAGQYTSIPKETSSAVYGGRIPSMNGFLLRFTEDETVYNRPDVYLTLKYGGGTAHNNRPQTAPAVPLSYLEIELSSRSTSDRLWLFSQPGSTTEGFDNGWDGRKFFGTPTAFIYSETPDGNMQVDASPTLDGKYITFYANADTEYTLYLNKHNLGDYPNLSLVDLATMEVIPLREGRTVYHFTSNSPNIGSKRFKLLGDRGEGTTGDMPLSVGDNITIQQFGSKLTVSNYTGQSGMMQIFDITGRLVISHPMNIGINSYDISLSDGVYLVTASNTNEYAREKVVIKR